MFRDEARAWAADDPDPATRAEVETWLESDDEDALREAFHRRLTFGTSGIRGPIGAGSSRVNRRLAREVAAGLASHLGPGAIVVVGRDARNLSPELAADVAAVLSGAGVRTLVFPGPVPTPVVAFSVRHLGCQAGVMVTASHNPPTDNGLKVYGPDGGQLVPPLDGQVAAAIDAVGAVRSLRLGEPTVLGDELLGAYLDAAAARVPRGERRVRVVHTALHGVATAPLRALFARAGLPEPMTVAAQAEPDGAFPTVASPNPEDPDALARALDEGTRVDADLVLATDPDADRLAVAVPDGNRWRVLTGDEIGILLADQALRTTDGPGRLVVSSIASSRMVGALAAAAGADWLTTPPGFKWIARAADARPGVRFTFGYEEALGYAVHDLVREKDALTAAAAFAVLVADLLAVGETVTARLDELDRRFGVHATARWSLHLPGADGARQLAHAIARLAADPPDELAGRRVRGMRQLAGDQLVELELDRDARVVVRPSGTEPKLKVHVEVVSSPADGLRLETARRAAHEEADAIRASMVAWLTEP